MMRRSTSSCDRVYKDLAAVFLSRSCGVRFYILIRNLLPEFQYLLASKFQCPRRIPLRQVQRLLQRMHLLSPCLHPHRSTLSTVPIWRNPHHTPQVLPLTLGRQLLSLVQLDLFSQFNHPQIPHEMLRLKSHKVESSLLHQSRLRRHCRYNGDRRLLYNSYQIHSVISSTIWVHSL